MGSLDRWLSCDGPASKGVLNIRHCSEHTRRKVGSQSFGATTPTSASRQPGRQWLERTNPIEAGDLCPNSAVLDPTHGLSRLLRESEPASTRAES